MANSNQQQPTEAALFFSQIKHIFGVNFIDVESPQFGLEATYIKDKPTIIINSGFINHHSVEKELLYIYTLHEVAHFFGFSTSNKLVLKTMINETWADYWAVKVGLAFLIKSAEERDQILRKAISQLRNYQLSQKPIETRQLEQYYTTEHPEVHLPISLRIALFENLLNGETFPDFIIENRRKPH